MLARAYLIVICFVTLATSQLARPSPRSPTQDGSLLTEQVDLARLLDLCAQRLKLNLEYDPAVVKGTITFRFAEAVSDDQLWVLTNRLLSTHGFTTVATAGEKTLSVVKLADAAGQARIEEGDPALAAAGFVKVLRRVERRSAKDLVAPLQLVLSKPGGSVSPAEGSDLLVIADLKPQVLKALEVLALLDVAKDASALQEFEAKHLPATELVTLVDRVLTTQTGLDPGAPTGKVIATPDEKRVLIIAPPAIAPRLLDLLEHFDRREAQSTVTYSPRSYSAREVARVVEQMFAGDSKIAGAPPFRLVVDDLTGTLFLTATATQHAQVAALLQRLESATASGRRPIRSFKLRNRPVSEVLSLLDSLIAAGVIESGNDAATPSTPSSKAEPPLIERVPPTPQGSTPPPTKETKPERPAANSSAGATGAGGDKKGAKLVTTPEVSLSADEGTNTLVAIGDGRVLAQIEKLIAELDVNQPQVMLQALVVALSDSDALDLGVEIQKLGVKDEIQGRLSSLFGLGSPDPASLTLPAPGGTGLQGVVLDPGSFSAVVSALQTLNHGHTLTIPRVLVNNNQQGRLDSVLQTPFQSTNASTTVATTSFGGTVDAGTTISMRPQIAEGDHLLLEYDVSVSNFVGDATSPTLPPPRQQNKIQSSVTIPDGFTVVVGGLAIDSDTRSTSQVPFLGSIPILGELFKNRSNTTTTSRLYVFLRADVMRGAGFELLRYVSDEDKHAAELDDGTPRMEPRFIR
jgi:type II secretory pathway component GspD/PulD (secretin)